ncbi:MAG: tRNA preQ1(34) S-adenosylmethionine ribosyltransferase-isomerase QueA [Polyangiaceae bacterium]
MRTDELDYQLPDDRIARHPTPERDGARMLVVESQQLRDAWVRDWAASVPGGSLVVVNDTRVLRARLLGRRRGTGGHVELLLLEHAVGSSVGGPVESWVALARPMRALKSGTWLDLDGLSARVVERTEEGCVVVELHSIVGASVGAEIERIGHVPIPPYLGRDDEPSDVERYQTVYANQVGSVAAPTAGLHLTDGALEMLRERGVRVGRTTLHVGIGTFRPVSVDDLDAHVMHTERYEVSEELANEIAETRSRGGRVVAVGTTVVRSLESASDPLRPGHVVVQSATTNLLIQPGYRFGVVDGLLTNFHQPRSTLLSLVAAAIGLQRMKEAYAVALARGYRFLSYGDAMWIPEILR